MVTHARADVLEQLREAILSGRIRPGDRLPGERQLCESFGVGRPTLREALRSLEATGMIEVRPGKGGGSYAVTPSESTVGAALSALLSLRGASPEDLAEFRVDFEGENAAWAARCADAADISALQAIVAEAGAVAEDTAGRSRLARIDVRWHEALRARPRTACASASPWASTTRSCAGTRRSCDRRPPMSTWARSPPTSRVSPRRSSPATPRRRACGCASTSRPGTAAPSASCYGMTASRHRPLEEP